MVSVGSTMRDHLRTMIKQIHSLYVCGVHGALFVHCSSAHESYQHDRGWLSDDATTAGE